MKVKDLIPIIEGNVEHIIVGTLERGVLAEQDKFPYCDSVETFLHRFKDLNVEFITPMGERELEITLKSDFDWKAYGGK